MNYPQKNVQAKKKYIIIATIAIVATLLVGWAIYSNISGNTPSSTPTQNSSSGKPDRTNQDDTRPNTPAGTANDPVRDTPIDPATGASARLSVPNYQANQGNLLINVAINEAWPSSASCTAKIIGPINKTVTETVFAQAQISGCQFNIPGLTSGQYEISIYANNAEQQTNTEKFTVKL